MQTLRIQRVVLPDYDSNPDLYFRSGAGAQHAPGVRVRTRRSALLAAASIFSTDTYFNALFPAHWCSLADVRAFVLKVHISGSGILRVVRAALGKAEYVVAELAFKGLDIELTSEVDVDNNDCDRPCLLYFEIRVDDEDVLLHRAEWLAVCPAVNDVSLIGGYCTFKREDYLLRNVDRIVRDQEAYEAVSRYIVVDNGRSVRLAEHFLQTPDKFSYLPQDNVGGAGGFARVILEALADPAITHILLLDDDALIEPESVLRLIAAFAICSQPVAVGGHMLDARRRTVLSEAGATYTPEKLKIVPLWKGLDLIDRDSLLLLSKPYHVDYNAWWFFGFPVTAAVAEGLPLPFFVRTDDIEFGYRLQKMGLATRTLPGIAVWHEPFYAKVGGCQSYFATRNLFVSAAIHQERWAKRAARTNLRRIVTCLLSLDYYEAWLHIRAAEDFLAGPAILEQEPALKLKELSEAACRWPVMEVEKARLLRALPLRRRFLFAPRLRKLERRLQIWRHWLLQASRLADPEDIEGVIDAAELAWWNLASRDYFAINYAYSFTYVVRQRDRTTFRRLYKEARELTIAIVHEEERLNQAWHDAFPRLTSLNWWTSYLKVDTERPSEHALAQGGHSDSTLQKTN